MPHCTGAKETPWSGGVDPAIDADRISALPDGVLQHVLGFLPAYEAVRTSVLAPRWRHRWRSMGRLRIISSHGWKSAHEFCLFVNRVFLHRQPACALDEVDGATLNGPALLSQHLTKLELAYVNLKGNFLDFSSCPVLEDLSIINSYVNTDKILSQSVKRLSIKGCGTNCTARIHICAPSVLWLHLDLSGAAAPLLQSMPSLETAFVKYHELLVDFCGKGVWGEYCGDCEICHGNDSHKGHCLLLGGLLSATNLELIAGRGLAIFNRDLRWCPTFSKLKTLLLNEWCVANDFSALVCILKHSPVLEKLTLHLAKGLTSAIVSEGIFDPTEHLPCNI
ncbi:hypothetical protein ACP70R_003799 [Stipagrostis hirtigluma subsp. patula]